MMFTVILLYGVCWMPIKLYQFLLDYGLINFCTEQQLYILVSVYMSCHWVSSATMAIHPSMLIEPYIGGHGQQFRQPNHLFIHEQKFPSEYTACIFNIRVFVF